MTTVDDTVTPIVAGRGPGEAPRRADGSSPRAGGAISSRSSRSSIAIFPAAYVVSAAFNGDQSITAASLIPRDLTLEQLRRELLHHRSGTSGRDEPADPRGS